MPPSADPLHIPGNLPLAGFIVFLLALTLYLVLTACPE